MTHRGGISSSCWEASMCGSISICLRRETGILSMHVFIFHGKKNIFYFRCALHSQSRKWRKKSIFNVCRSCRCFVHWHTESCNRKAAQTQPSNLIPEFIRNDDFPCYYCCDFGNGLTVCFILCRDLFRQITCLHFFSRNRVCRLWS